jgi:hypothetical protein
MTDDVMTDPLPENIEGQKVVTHRFDHGIDWQVNVSHVLLAVVAVAVVFVVYKNRDGENSQEEGGETGGVTTR